LGVEELKKLQIDGESFIIKDVFAVANEKAKGAHSEAIVGVSEGRKNLNQFVNYKRRLGRQLCWA
jgi:hypothetical protein